MASTLFKSMLFTVSLFIMASFFVLRIKPIGEYISFRRSGWTNKVLIGVLFGVLGIVSTITGTRVNGAIANTRAIGMVASGLLGGPIAGLISGVIAGGHRFLADIHGFTAVACAVSTIMEGLIGGWMRKFYVRTYYRSEVAFCTAFVAEILQMLIILGLARPIADAWELVKVIAMPMILLNSVGVTMLMWSIEYVEVERDLSAARRTKQALIIAQQCLPYLRKGLANTANLQKATDIMASLDGVSGVAITNRVQVVACSGKSIQVTDPLPDIVAETMRRGSDVQPDADDDSPLTPDRTITAPLIIQDRVVGCLMWQVTNWSHDQEMERSFVSGLAALFSSQLELSNADYQKQLLRKAEFQRLQSQINPHFFFNSLNTIAAFCREKPARARELLLTLSDYFRKSLDAGEYMVSLQEELEYVRTYLELEKARFEDKLRVVIEVPEDLACTMPRLILQPIVENAIKHGISKKRGGGTVWIQAEAREGGVLLSVRDPGPGIPEEVSNGLRTGLQARGKIGLTNVHQRLISIYGESNGLMIERPSEGGTQVSLWIPNTMGGEHDANSHSG